MEKTKFNQLLKNYKTDRESFIKLYEYYYHRIVFHIAFKFSKDIAEDVAQEFFVKLMRIEIEEDIEYPTTWVYTVCDNLAKTLVKKFKSYEQLTGDEFYEFSSNIAEREMIKDALSILDELDKKIIAMYYWEGYSLKEIAEILKYPYETIKKRHSRALKKIQKKLKNVSLNWFLAGLIIERG